MILLTYALLLQALEAYLKQADPKRKLIILSYVGVWTKVQACCLPQASVTASCLPVTLKGSCALRSTAGAASLGPCQCCCGMSSHNGCQHALMATNQFAI
jgi:hypothetical protein